jgi:hypothetical protein
MTQPNAPLRAIISLCDYSGAWSAPYVGTYVVLRIDPKHGGRTGAGRGLVPDSMDDVPVVRMDDGGWGIGCTAGEFRRMVQAQGLAATVRALTGVAGVTQTQGVIAMPPCTDFTVSGAQYWKAKDEDGRTAASVQIVRDCLALIDTLSPAWWVMENPVGRIQKLVPELGAYRMWFQPHHYGDAYTKRTHLWGRFNADLPRNDVDPVRACAQGSWLQKLGGSSEKTKALRSMTPPGFARAWSVANP